MTMCEIDLAIHEQIAVANARYGVFTSAHEGLGVLIEEVRELEDAIRVNASESVRLEAIQIAAVATRLAYSMSVDRTLRRSGMRDPMP